MALADSSGTPLTVVPRLEPAALRAYRVREGVATGQLWVWCEHERLWHRHGGRCSCDEEPCVCPVGVADGHRGAHCRCPESPHAGVGYVLREAGELTNELRAQYVEATYLRGCRDGWCQHARAQRAHALQHPDSLPPPDDPLAVARQLLKGYAALDWTERDEEEAWRRLWEDPAISESAWADVVQRADELAPEGQVSAIEPPKPEPAPPLDYDDRLHGPLVLRRWRGNWMRWRETHWQALEEGELQAEMYERLGAAKYVKLGKVPRWETWKPNRHSVGEVLAALDGIAHLPSDVDDSTWLGHHNRDRPTQLIACRNGLLDLRTRMLSEHDPEWFNLVSVPFAYDHEAPPPERWLRFLAELWPEDPDAIRALQEWFGYVLSGRTDLQKMLLVVGPPRSGKGTLVRVLQQLVGKANCAGPTLASLGQNFGLQAMIGKPLAVVADARLSGKDTHVVVERLLSISGEDTLTVDRKYRDAWTGRLPTRVTILSNELPHFGDASGAIATRFVTLTMERSWLGQEDIDLERHLHAELPGILRWALDGLGRLDQQRRFTEPASSGEAVVAMADSASPTGAFVRDYCTVGAGEEVTAQALFAAWRGWCNQNGREHPGSEQTFGRTLRSVVPTLKVTRPRDAAGRQVRTYQGLSLSRAESRTPYLYAEGNGFRGAQG